MHHSCLSGSSCNAVITTIPQHVECARDWGWTPLAALKLLPAPSLPTPPHTHSFLLFAGRHLIMDISLSLPKVKVALATRCRNGLLVGHGSEGKESCLQCRRPRFDPWVGKILGIKEQVPTPVFLPGESHGQRSLAGYSPWGHKESDTTERLTLPTSDRGSRNQRVRTASPQGTQVLERAWPGAQFHRSHSSVAPLQVSCVLVPLSGAGGCVVFLNICDLTGHLW